MAPKEKLQAGSAAGPRLGQHTLGDESGSLAGTRADAEGSKEAANPQHVDGSLFYDAQEGMQDALLVTSSPGSSCCSPVTLKPELKM